MNKTPPGKAIPSRPIAQRTGQSTDPAGDGMRVERRSAPRRYHGRGRAGAKKLFLLFWIWPFGAFMMAVRNIHYRAYHPIILMFSFVYGYSVYMYSGDVVRYAESFQNFCYVSWSDYLYLLKNSYTGQDYSVGSYGIIATQPDIYALSLQFQVSRFTENPRWFFAIVSLVYTWFFLKFVQEVVPEIRWTSSWPQKIFFIYLLLVVPFYVGVTGVRFWTALFLYMTFALRYIKYLRPRDAVLAAASVLMHFSFAVPVAILFAYRFLKLNRLMSGALVLAALVFFGLSSSIQVAEYIQGTSSYFQDTRVEDRIEGYTNQQNLAQRTEKVAGTNWYVQLRSVALLYFLIAAFLLEFLGILRWRQNGFLEKLQPFYFIFFVVALLSFNLGSIGRFKNIFYILALIRYTILCGENIHNRHLRFVALTLAPVLLLHILVSIGRAGLYTVDPLLLVSPPFVMFVTQSSMSLSELLVGH